MYLIYREGNQSQIGYRFFAPVGTTSGTQEKWAFALPDFRVIKTLSAVDAMALVVSGLWSAHFVPDAIFYIFVLIQVLQLFVRPLVFYKPCKILESDSQRVVTGPAPWLLKQGHFLFFLSIEMMLLSLDRRFNYVGGTIFTLIICLVVFISFLPYMAKEP
jgi:Ca2+/Na+ antiporter